MQLTVVAAFSYRALTLGDCLMNMLVVQLLVYLLQFVAILFFITVGAHLLTLSIPFMVHGSSACFLLRIIAFL